MNYHNRFIIEKSKDKFYTSHSDLTLVGLGINRFTSLCQRLGELPRMIQGAISHANVVRSYFGLLCLGKSDFAAFEYFRKDKFFINSLGLKKVPSEPTLRQRLEQHAETFQHIVNSCGTGFLHKSGALFSPLDIDVFTQDNSGTRKEGVSRTYKGMDGFAPSPLIWP